MTAHHKANSPSEAITISFKSGFVPLAYDKTSYWSFNEARLDVADLNGFAEQEAEKEKRLEELQMKANLGF